MSIVTPAGAYYTSSTGRVHPDSLAARRYPRRRDDVVVIRSRPAAPVEPPTDAERLANVEAAIDALAGEVREIAAAPDLPGRFLRRRV